MLKFGHMELPHGHWSVEGPAGTGLSWPLGSLVYFFQQSGTRWGFVWHICQV